MKAFQPTIASSATSSAVRGAAATPNIGAAIQPNASVHLQAQHVEHNKMAAHTASSFPAPTHAYAPAAPNAVPGAVSTHVSHNRRLA